MYICFKNSIDTTFVAMPKYVVSLADVSPTPLDLEAMKTVVLSGIVTMYVGHSITVTVTATALPISGSVTYTLGFVSQYYDSKISVSNTVTYAAGSSLSQTITITPLAALIDKPIQLVPSGTAFEYVTSATSLVTIHMSVTVVAPPKARETITFTITLSVNENPGSDVTVTPTVSGAVFTPTSVTFTP
eukprot:PhM_4_TR1308/c3_g3_i1/m.105481